jgi:hypothetical protein
MASTDSRPLDADVIYPRDEEHRYRIYARRGSGRTVELEVLACAGTPAGLGVALVTLDEDEKEHGRRLVDLGAIGVLDAVDRRWIVMPWHRPEERTRLRNLEVEL